MCRIKGYWLQIVPFPTFIENHFALFFLFVLFFVVVKSLKQSKPLLSEKVAQMFSGKNYRFFFFLFYVKLRCSPWYEQHRLSWFVCLILFKWELIRNLILIIPSMYLQASLECTDKQKKTDDSSFTFSFPMLPLPARL